MRAAPLPATMPSTAAIDIDAVHALYGETMGTRWRVDLCAPPRAALNALHARVQSRLDGIVAQMSTWEPDSGISRFNRAEAGSWQTLPADFFDVLSCALAIARDSGGAFDPTVGPLVSAWGFGALAHTQGVPEADELAKARARTGWRRIALDAPARRAYQPGGVSLDLSAIAKGFGVDAVVATLREAGIGAALVDVGGELRGFGRKPDGTPWRVLVEADDADDADDDMPCVLSLDDKAVATSGTRWHRYESGGRVYAHTIDPRSGRPVEDAPAAVTVVAGDAMHADAWATALTVMGCDAGHAFARERGIAARFVHRPSADDGPRVVSTPAFDACLAA